MSQPAVERRRPLGARPAPSKLAAILSSSLVVCCLFASLEHAGSLWPASPGVLAAQLAQPARSLAAVPHEPELIGQLNLTNFNTELIQSKHQFAHIKLIEFYVAYCGFCTKFKQTLLSLAREIQPWKNVIRPAAIDISLPLNLPIANAKPVDEVPKLRLHPPPYKALADHFDKQLTALRNHFGLDQSLLQASAGGSAALPLADAQTELQKSMLDEYNLSNLMIEPLENTTKYLDNVPLLKAHLLNYVERFVHHRTRVQQHPLPSTWPNLSPVTETSLDELRRNHPRKELFLIIEGQPAQAQLAAHHNHQQHNSESSQPETDQSSTGPVSLGLSIMMELSSVASWRAVRYVRASENKPLIEDVISKLNATPSAGAQITQTTTPTFTNTTTTTAAADDDPTNTTTTTTTTNATSSTTGASVTTTTSTTTTTTTTTATASSTDIPQSVTGQSLYATTLAILPKSTGVNPASQNQHHRHHLLGLHNNNNQNLHSEHLELLNNLLMNKTKNGNNILLVHIADLNPLQQYHHQHQVHQQHLTGDERSLNTNQDNVPQKEATLIQPFISIISGSDLAAMDHPEMLLDSSLEQSSSNNGGRAKRVVVIDHQATPAAEKVQVQPRHDDEKNSVPASSNVNTERQRRSMAMSSVRPSMPEDQISRERLVELVSSYIRQAYTETDEDREFVRAINQMEEPYQIPQGFNYIVIACFGCLSLIVVLRCANSYVERQRRHKATLLNGNGAHYTLQSEMK